MSRPEKFVSNPDFGAESAHRQFAALCWRMHGGAPEILLITSRDTGRWIVPKGWPIRGQSPHGVAAVEAWEEAGVEGRIAEESLGSFSYAKILPKGDARTCLVEVFPLKVGSLARHYPERRERRRKWFSAAKAARKVAEPELRSLILGFAGKETAPSPDDTP